MPAWINLEEATRALHEGDGAGVTVAVLDSGIQTSHPQLNGVVLKDDIAVVPQGHKLAVIPGNGLDVYGHGTAVAGIILSLAPKCQLGSFRVLGGIYNTSKTEIIQRGAQEALDRGYRVFNCSFGCAVQQHVLRYKSWVDEAYLNGIHVVAACNNQDFRIPEWPAYFPSVVAVNMMQIDDDSIFFYQRGTLVEFAAKGINVKVAWVGSRERLMTGSSFAAPRLAALLARLLSVYPDITPIQAKAILHKIARRWQNGHREGNVKSS